MQAIDLFAGCGGFSEGAALAGVEVIWAANHLPLAVEYHGRNHPNALHVCQDLHQADWTKVPRMDVILASPCCQGHTKARGKDRPYHDASRSTAWAVVSAAEYHNPYGLVVENVPEFREWKLYRPWRTCLEALGYACAEYDLDAADHGVPQHRLRSFLVFTQSEAPIQLRLPKRDHVPFRSVVEWDEGSWSDVNKPGRSPATLARIASGRARHGNRFVAPYYSSGSGMTGRSLDRPLGTVTTKDRWSLVDGDKMRMLTVKEYKRVMGFRDDYEMPNNRAHSIHLLGNAVCPPQAADILTALKEAA